MADLEFVFRYHPKNKGTELDAYDASQALYGISRSLSIFTHYALNGKVIKKAPALSGAQVLIKPPQKRSFEFLLPIVQVLSDASPQAAVSLNFVSSRIYDLAKASYKRLIGKKDKPETAELRQIARTRPGDLDAIADSIEEDVNRIHRPLIMSVTRINIYMVESK
ncbi:MAG TPA: hypothetical protein VGC15_23240 [Acetobacteraceae bacterium]